MERSNASQRNVTTHYLSVSFQNHRRFKIYRYKCEVYGIEGLKVSRSLARPIEQRGFNPTIVLIAIKMIWMCEAYSCGSSYKLSIGQRSVFGANHIFVPAKVCTMLLNESTAIITPKIVLVPYRSVLIEMVTIFLIAR